VPKVKDLDQELLFVNAIENANGKVNHHPHAPAVE
jgi:pterin-4a-carbinolamine dehydratase